MFTILYQKSAIKIFQTVVSFGLIDRTYDTDDQYDPDRKETQWQRFHHQVSHMNLHGDDMQYKVLFLV